MPSALVRDGLPDVAPGDGARRRQMTRAEALAVLADGERHYLPPGVGGLLVASGSAERVEVATFDEAIAIKAGGFPPVRITDRGRRAAERGR
jgi:hypothetical protein